MSDKIRNALSKSKKKAPKSGPKLRPSTTRSKSTNPAKGGSKTSKPKAPAGPKPPKVTSVGALEGEPNKAASAPRRSQSVVREQSRLARELSGSRTDSSPASTQSAEPQVLVHPDSQTDSAEPQVLVHPDFERVSPSEARNRRDRRAPSGSGDAGGPVASGPNSELPKTANDSEPAGKAPAPEGPNSDLAPTAQQTESSAQESEESSGGLFGSLIDKGRDLVENTVEKIGQHVEEQRADAAQFEADAEEAYTRFNQNPEELTTRIDKEGLEQLSDPERYALAQFADENEAVGNVTSAAVLEDIENFESFSDIPSDIGSQILLDRYSGEEQQEKIGNLVVDHLTDELEKGIEAAGQGENAVDGDDQADKGIDRVLDTTEDLVDSHPALRPYLEDSVYAALENSSDLIGKTRRNDDGAFSRVIHSATGWISDRAEEEKAKIRGWVDSAGDFVADANLLGGRAASRVVDTVGDLVAEDFDQLGLDGVGDQVRGASDRISDGVTSVSEVQAENAKDIVTGAGEGAISLGYGPLDIVKDPVSTVVGLSKLTHALTSPTATNEERKAATTGLYDGVTADIRATNDEHGAVAAGAHAAFDIITTVGTGGSSGAGKTAVNTARRAGQIGKAASNLDELAVVGRLDDLGDAAKIADDVARLGDDAARLGDEAARLGDDASNLGDDAARLGDDASDAGESAGRRIADRVEDSKLGDAFRRFSERRHSRASRRFRDDNPKIAADLDEVGVDLKNLLGEEAPPLTVERVRDFATQNRDLARSLDELHSGQRTPRQVGEVIEVGREAVLDRVLRNLEDGPKFNNLDDAEKARFLKHQGRALRDIFSASDPSAQVFVTRLEAGSSVFRGFKGSNGPGGRYFARIFDRRDTAEKLAKRNAQPKKNAPDSGVLIELSEPETVIVSRVAPQSKDNIFGDDLSGGAVQLFPLDDLGKNGIVKRLEAIDAKAFELGDLPEGVERINL